MRIEPNWTPLDKLIREMGANPRPRTLNVVPLDEMKEIAMKAFNHADTIDRDGKADK